MIRLGEVKGRGPWERISFKDWISKGLASAGQYSVRAIFPPARYPTFTVIFEDASHGMEVRLSLKAEKLREAFKALGLQLQKKDLPAMIFVVEMDEAGMIYGLEVDTEPFVLEWRGTFWLRRSRKELDEFLSNF